MATLKEDLIDVSTALGKGVYSVGEDVFYGVQRTGQGLGLGKDGRIADIGAENRAAFNVIKGLLASSITDPNNPFYQAIFIALKHYYEKFPDDAVEKLAKAAGVAAGYGVGRMVIGTALAKQVALKIAGAIAATAAYKAVARQLGVSAGLSATGVGVPIGMLMFQGVLQRSSMAAERLRIRNPKLYADLERNGDLQVLYFLLEKPLEKYLTAIDIANRDIQYFHEEIRKNHDLSAGVQ